MMKMKFLFIFIFLGMFITSFAHKPIFDDLFHGDFESALIIKEPQVSQITYHEFSDEEPEFWIKFLGQKNEEIQIVLNIPYHERFSDLEVYMALFRKVSDDLGDSEHKTVGIAFPFEVPDEHDGVILHSRLYEREFFHEPFSNTESWFILRERFTPLETGVYYVAIWPEKKFQPDGRVGFSIGTLERFSALDLFKMPQWIQGIREFHEVP